MNFESKIAQIDELQKEINTYRPLKENILKQLKEYFKIGLTYSSNSLEGNSLTETETKIILEDGLTIGGKTLKEHYEATGHGQAFDLMYDLSREKVITEQQILSIHKLFYYRIDIENAGAYRKKPIIVTGTSFTFPSPQEVPEQMTDLIQELPKFEQAKHPVEYAALLHTKFVTIHPFIDGNGRTARLLMNLALMQHGYVVTMIPPILRRDYLEAIGLRQGYGPQVKAGNESKHTPFINFLSSMVYEGQKDYLRILRTLSL